jgi:hypothetical protein
MNISFHYFNFVYRKLNYAKFLLCHIRFPLWRNLCIFDDAVRGVRIYVCCKSIQLRVARRPVFRTFKPLLVLRIRYSNVANLICLYTSTVNHGALRQRKQWTNRCKATVRLLSRERERDRDRPTKANVFCLISAENISLYLLYSDWDIR